MWLNFGMQNKKRNSTHIMKVKKNSTMMRKKKLRLKNWIIMLSPQTMAGSTMLTII